jgi:hypothetical protein
MAQVDNSTLDALRAEHGAIKPFRLKDGTIGAVRKCTAEERTAVLERMAGSQNAATWQAQLALSAMVLPADLSERQAVLKRYPTLREKLADFAWDLAEGGSCQLTPSEVGDLASDLDARSPDGWRCYSLRDGRRVAIRPWTLAEQARFHDKIGQKGRRRSKAEAIAADELARSVVIHPTGPQGPALLDEFPCLADTLAWDARDIADGGLEELGEA